MIAEWYFPIPNYEFRLSVYISTSQLELILKHIRKYIFQRNTVNLTYFTHLAFFSFNASWPGLALWGPNSNTNYIVMHRLYSPDWYRQYGTYCDSGTRQPVLIPSWQTKPPLSSTATHPILPADRNRAPNKHPHHLGDRTLYRRAIQTRNAQNLTYGLTAALLNTLLLS